MLLITEMRRKRLRNSPFPPAWELFLETGVPLYGRLPEEDREELKGAVLVLLAEKSFEGCGGFPITDEVRLTVAAQACLLLLHRETDYFPGLSSIVIYPREYLAPQADVDESGVVTEWTDILSGETNRVGTIVLSWEDVMAEGLETHEAYNVVLHEFAHQLDAEYGITSGAPLLARRSGNRPLVEGLERGHRRLKDELLHGRATVLDPYGEESLEEFFAVATESFFMRPLSLMHWDFDLFRELVRYYRQNPSEWKDIPDTE
jgi:Mlc titration factor MtfA (ptsG expression regulator)